MLGRSKKKQPVDPDHPARGLQRRRRHRRGQGRDHRGRGLPQEPRQVPPSGRPCPQGRPARGRTGHGQDPAGPGHRRRGGRPLLLRQRVGVHRDDRGRRCAAGCASSSRRPARSPPRSSSSTRSTPSVARGRVLEHGRSRRARADPEPDPHRDGRVLGHRGGGRHRGHQPPRRARPRAAAPGPVRPHRSPSRPPDHKGRVEILQVHAREVPLAKDVDLDAARQVHARDDRRRARQPGQRGRAQRGSPRAGTRSARAT